MKRVEPGSGKETFFARVRRMELRHASLAIIVLTVSSVAVDAAGGRVETHEYTVGVLPSDCGANVLLSGETCFRFLPGDASISISIEEEAAAEVTGPIRALVRFTGVPPSSQFVICDKWENVRIPSGATGFGISVTSGHCGTDLTVPPGVVVHGTITTVFYSVYEAHHTRLR